MIEKGLPAYYGADSSDDNIMWHICSKQELWSQKNSRCHVMPARNNTGIVTKQDVMRTAIATEQLSKKVSPEANTHNSGIVLSVRSMPRRYRKCREDRLRQLTFETSACQDMSLGAEELN
jgi:hypothetical protein